MKSKTPKQQSRIRKPVTADLFSPPKPQPTREMMELAQQSYIARQIEYQNRCKADKALKELQRLMINTDVTDFVVTAGDAIVDVTYGPGTAEYIDVRVLRQLVDDATFMKIVRATKGDTETHAGAVVCIKATRTSVTEAKTRLKQRKL